MGKSAYEFVDFLQRSGQSYWQILPLSPTGYGDSPYQAFSAYAGNHYLIDLDQLIDVGLLNREEVTSVSWGDDALRVNYGCLYENRSKVLRCAFKRFVPNAQYERFVAENAIWLEGYALFMALKSAFGGKPWQEWPEELRMRQPDALAACVEKYGEEIHFQYFLQFVFFCQWDKLRDYANKKGIRIVGDIPIYVPLDSADVWMNPGLFQLNAEYRPVKVAGCPPDSFSADGQLWGNPLYDWDAMKSDGFRWWIARLKAAERMYDVVRLDHFRGFESYWAVPAEDTTAIGGAWEKGPGMDLIGMIKKKLPKLAFIAEDLGFVTTQVRQLQEESGYPGMKVLQFAFDSREEGNYLPYTYPENSVCYTGTHDNPTLVQWLQEAAPEDIATATAYLGLNDREGYVRGMIRGCMSSNSALCVVQMQDYLELGSEARMNFPGTQSANNWTWRAESGFMTEELSQRILNTTRLYGR